MTESGRQYASKLLGFLYRAEEAAIKETLDRHGDAFITALRSLPILSWKKSNDKKVIEEFSIYVRNKFIRQFLIFKYIAREAVSLGGPSRRHQHARPPPFTGS